MKSWFQSFVVVVCTLSVCAFGVMHTLMNDASVQIHPSPPVLDVDEILAPTPPSSSSSSPKVCGGSDSGLFGKAGKAFKLIKFSSSSQVINIASETHLRLEFENDGDDQEQAVFRFPLADGASVTGFKAIVGERTVVAEIQPTQKAKQIYKAAVARGDGAFLGEKLGSSEIFSLSLGNFLPRSRCTIEIEYIAEMKLEGSGSVRYTLPLVMVPRYTPSTSSMAMYDRTSQQQQPLQKDQVLTTTSSSTVDVSVTFMMSRPIMELKTPSHPDDPSLSIHGSTVSFKNMLVTRDLVILCNTFGALNVNSVAEVITKEVVNSEKCEWEQEHSVAVMLSVIPHLAESTSDSQKKSTSSSSSSSSLEQPDYSKKEIIFLVDRSGSMADKIELMKSTLQLVLHSIPMGVNFNIVSFGWTFQPLFPEGSVPLNDKNLKAASSEVQQFLSNFGGTEILNALESKFVYNSPANPSITDRVVVVFTDGEVNNPQACIQSAEQSHNGPKRVRTFTFGLGNGASHSLVTGMARAGGGESDFVMSNSEYDVAVVRQLRRILTPMFQDIQVEWRDDVTKQKFTNVEQAPRISPPIFLGEPYTLFALFPNAADAGEEGGTTRGFIPTTVRLTAKSNMGDHIDIVKSVKIIHHTHTDHMQAGRAMTMMMTAKNCTSISSEKMTMEKNQLKAKYFSSNNMMPSYSSSPSFLHKLAAKRLIMELEADGDPKNAAKNSERILELGMKYSLATPETSFVAVDERGKAANTTTSLFPDSNKMEEKTMEVQEAVEEKEKEAAEGGEGRGGAPSTESIIRDAERKSTPEEAKADRAAKYADARDEKMARKERSSELKVKYASANKKKEAQDYKQKMDRFRYVEADMARRVPDSPSEAQDEKMKYASEDAKKEDFSSDKEKSSSLKVKYASAKKDKQARNDKQKMDRAAYRYVEADMARRVPDSPSYLRLALLNQADGSWSWEDQVFDAFMCKTEGTMTMMRAQSQFSSLLPLEKKKLITTMAVLRLQSHFKKNAEQWDMIARKALAFLGNKTFLDYKKRALQFLTQC